MPRIGKLICYSSYERFSDEELVPASTSTRLKLVEHQCLLPACDSSMPTHEVNDEGLLVWVVLDEVLDALGGFADFLVGGVFQVEFMFDSQWLR